MIINYPKLCLPIKWSPVLLYAQIFRFFITTKTPYLRKFPYIAGGATLDYHTSFIYNAGIMSTEIFVSGLWRYPIKGLAGESLTTATLTPQQGIAFDRRWFLATKDISSMVRGEEKWRPWNYGLALKNTARLVCLHPCVEDDNGTLVLSITVKELGGTQDGESIRAAPATPSGKKMIEDFVCDFLSVKNLQLLDCQNQPVWDTRDVCLTVLNEASVTDFATRWDGATISCRRFRGNVELRGMTAWQETTGGTLTIGDAKLTLGAGVPRCAATLVNPQNAERDLKIPNKLLEFYGHNEMGVEAEIIHGGDIAVGASVCPPTA